LSDSKFHQKAQELPPSLLLQDWEIEYEEQENPERLFLAQGLLALKIVHACWQPLELE
jgi:hypothetical protein